MSESARLRLPFLAAAQAQKHVTHNEALVALDTLVQLSVLDKDLDTPPAEPEEGDCYIVAATATGAWTGWENRIARYEDGDWRSFLPGAGGGAGWLAFVQDEAALYVFDGTDWVAVGSGGGGGEGEANTASNLGSTSGRQGVFAAKSGVDLRFKSLVAAGGLSLSADASEVTVDGSGKVGTARTIGTSGLATGGGDLSADRTIGVPIASQAEAEAGTDNAKAMTPLRTAEAIAALAPGGGGSGEANTASNLGDGEGLFASKSGVDLRFKSLEESGLVGLSSDANEVTIAVPKASEAEAQAGSEDGKAMTPLRTKDSILALFSLAAALIADESELTQGTAGKLVSAARLIEILTPQTIADSAAMSMDMRAGWHAVVDEMAQDGTFTITNPQPGLSGWVLFQTDGSARTVQFQSGAVNMGEAWTGTRQKVFGASSKWMGHYTVQPGGGSPYLQWTFVKEGA